MRWGWCVAGLASVCLFTTAADWPTYLSDGQRSGASTETILSPTNAAQLTKLWSYKTGGVVAASVSVVGGVAYGGSWDGYEYALNASTGALIWKTFLGTTSAPGCSPPALGISSAAAVANGVVYVGGGDSYWYALDAGSGAILWQVFTGDNSASGGHYNWSSPLLYNGYAYIGVASLGDCPLVQGQLLQVSLSTHQVVHTFNVVPDGQVGGGIWTSPAVDATSNTIYVTTGTIGSTTETLSQAILAIDASALTLKDSWQLPASQAVTDSDWGNTPTLFTDSHGVNLVTAINKNGYAYAWNRTNLAAGPVWQVRVAVGGACPTCGDGSVSSGAFANGTLFLAGGNTTVKSLGYPGGVRALDPATGNFKWEHGSPSPVVPAIAYDNGLVIDGAGRWLEVLNAADGTRLYSYQAGGTLYAAPSVANGEIFVGGVDGNIYAFGLGASPQQPPPDSNCPSGWTCQDVGTVTPAGSEAVSGSTWNLAAGGTALNGTTDAFRFITQTVSGDLQAAARVTAVSSATPAAAGVMVRQTNSARAAYYGVFVTAGGGITVNYRTAFAGSTHIITSVASIAPPVYLEVVRLGDLFQAATSADGQTWTLIPGSNQMLALPTSVMAGAAFTSSVNASSATATFVNAIVGTSPANPNPYPPPTACPNTWSCADVGNPALVGDQSLSSGTWTVKGAGIDINNYADQFHFVWQALSGDGSASARVASQTNTAGTAKTGVMLRQSTDTGSPYYAAFLTPSNGVQVWYRSTQGLRPLTIGITGTAPVFLQVSRAGNTFSAYTSPDGTAWTQVPGSSVMLSMTPTLLAGLAVTSANAASLSTATLDTVLIKTAAPPPPGCPSGWSCADIGSPALAGSQSLSGSTWTIQAGGNDISAKSDQFHYVWQTLSAGGSVSAQVTSQTNTSSNAKAGVMLRSSTDAGAANYAVFVTPSNGIKVQYRSAQGGTTVKAANPPGGVPVYLQVAASGNTFTAYTSSDGVTWTPIPQSTVTLNLGTPLLAGLAVTSHNVNKLGTATMDTVVVSSTAPPPPPPPPCPTGWSCADIGSPQLAGSQSLSGGTWTIQGAGGDIWTTADQFHYVWKSLATDGSVRTHVTAQTNTSAWAKAGVMLRSSTDPGSPNYAVFVTPANGITVQYRSALGGTTVKVANPAGTVPAYLQVTRSGSTLTAYTSSDGVTWTLIPNSTVTANLGATVLEGLAVTSHNVGALCTVTMDSVATS